MIPIETRIESLIHQSFLDFREQAKLDALTRLLHRLAHASYTFKQLSAIKGEVDELISLAEYPGQTSPDEEGFPAFIHAEKMAALRLLKFNEAAELSRKEEILDLPRQKTTATSFRLKPYTLKLYYCVIRKNRDFYILIDTNFHQFHWALNRVIKSIDNK